MMKLQDIRRENFCSLIVRGGGITDSYEKAGYSPNPGNASKMFHQLEIQARIRELKIEAAEGSIVAIDDILKNGPKTDEDLELTKTWVLEQLMLLAQNAKLEKQHNAAFRCIELMGEYLGMWGKLGKNGVDRGGISETKKSKAPTASSLANLVHTFRKMDKEQEDAANNLAKDAQADTEVTDEPEDGGDGAGNITDTSVDVDADKD